MQIPSPMVVICPQIKFDSNSLNFTELNDDLMNGIEPMIDNMTWIVAKNMINLLCEDEIGFYSKPPNLKLTPNDIMRKLRAYAMKNILVNCKIVGNGEVKDEDCSSFVQLMVTHLGVCYAINQLPASHIFRNGVYVESGST